MYVGVNDVLLLRAFAPGAAQTVRVSLRWLNPAGEVIPEFYSVAVTPNGATPTTKVMTGAEGFLLSASIDAVAALRGACYVTLELQRGQGSGDSTFGNTLIAGYASSVSRLTYPEGQIAATTDGRGLIGIVGISNPAAGAEWSQAVPAGQQWILRAARATLTTAIAVANRFPTLLIDDGSGNITVSIGPTAAQLASLVDTYNWFNGGFGRVSNLTTILELPFELRLPPGFIIRTLTAGIAAADQWSAIDLLVESFVNG